VFFWELKNAGRRPGKITRIETTGSVSRVCTDHPIYKTKPGKVPFPFGNESSSRAFLIPDATIKSIYTDSISVEQYAAITDPTRNQHYCVYLRLEYEDALDKSTHHTKDCRTYGVGGSFFECDNAYPDAD